MGAFRDLKTRARAAGQYGSSLVPRDSWERLTRCDVLLVCSDADRSVILGDRAYSPLLDSVGDDLRARGFAVSSMATPYSVLRGDRATGSPATANRAAFRAALKRRGAGLLGRVLGNPTQESPAHSQGLLDLYRKILHITGCRCVVAIGAPPMLCRAGREAGVPVVELMHALGLPRIPPDSQWAVSAGYELPRAFLSLDPVTTEALRVQCGEHSRIFEIPHPWLKRFTDPVAHRQLPSELTKGIDLPVGGRRTILFSCQWGYDGELPELRGIIPNGIMPEGVRRAIEETQDTVFWMLRLHPVQRRSRRYRHHVKYMQDLVKRTGNCEWEESSARPLPTVIQQCDGHVTMMSMTCYEAAYFGVPNLLLCPSLRPGAVYEDYFRDLIAEGIATLGVTDPQQIRPWVETACRSTLRFPTPEGNWDEALSWMLGEVRRSAPSPIDG